MEQIGNDPEQEILMGILQKMLKKHNLISEAGKSEYIKFRPRQWENIEDKLKALDITKEISKVDHQKNFRKDYVKQI